MKYIRVKRAEGFGVCFLNILAGIGLSLLHEGELQYVYDPYLIKYRHGVNNTDVLKLIDLQKLFPIPPDAWHQPNKGRFNINKIHPNCIQIFPGLSGYIEQTNQEELYVKAANYLKPHINPIETPFSSEFTNVAIHVRRGDVMRDKYVPITVFEKYIDNLLSIPSPKPYKFYIYTQHEPNFDDHFKNIIKIPNTEFILDASHTDSSIYKIPSKDRGKEAMKTWYSLSSADILCTGNSAFSYTAALFNPNTIHNIPFKTTKAPKHWIPVAKQLGLENFENLPFS